MKTYEVAYKGTLHIKANDINEALEISRASKEEGAVDLQIISIMELIDSNDYTFD